MLRSGRNVALGSIRSSPPAPYLDTHGITNTIRTEFQRIDEEEIARKAESDPVSASLDAPKQTEEADRSPDWADADDDFQPTGFQTRIHGSRLRDLLATADRLRDCGTIDLHRRSRKIRRCCLWPHVRVNPEIGVAASIGRCRDRLCPTCASLRASEIRLRVAHALQKTDSLRLITLTLRATPGPLREKLDRLHEAFRCVRKTRTWKDHVSGGIAMIEIKLGSGSGEWHPHLHVIATGKYLPQDSLSRLWKEVTGDSSIVDIRKIHERKGAAAYVAKYAAKPPGLLTWTDDRIREYAEAVAGRRFLVTFGSLHNQTVDPRPKREGLGSAAKTIPAGFLLAAMEHSPYIIRPAVRTLARLGSWMAPMFAHRFTEHEMTHDPEDHEIAEATYVISRLAELIDGAGDSQIELCEEAKGDDASWVASRKRKRIELRSLTPYLSGFEPEWRFAER